MRQSSLFGKVITLAAILCLMGAIETLSVKAEFLGGSWTNPTTTGSNGYCPSGYIHIDLDDSGDEQNGECWQGAKGVIVKDGNVGIGTTVPGAKLDVAGGRVNVSGDSSDGMGVIILGSNTYPGGLIAAPFGTGDLLIRASASATNGILFQDGATTRMTIEAGGNVGIGTPSPRGQLHVQNGTGGFLFWNSDDVDDIEQTIIPDGANDVKYTLSIVYAARDSNGNVNSGVTARTEPGSYAHVMTYLDIYCNSDGSVTIKSSSGTVSYKVALHLVWL